MSDNVIGTVKNSNGKEFHVKWDGGRVYVKEISGLWVAPWDGPSQKPSSSGEAMRLAEAFIRNK